jgi:hypothetical protein
MTNDKQKLKCEDCGQSASRSTCDRDVKINEFTGAEEGVRTKAANRKGLCPYHTNRFALEVEDEKV